MTRAAWWLAPWLLAASLGVATDTSTSGTASRQNDLSNHPLPLSRSAALPVCDGWAIDRAAWLRIEDDRAFACSLGSAATDLRSGTGSEVKPTPEELDATGRAAAAHRSARQENFIPSKRPVSSFRTTWEGGHSSRPDRLETREIASGVLRSTREGQGAAAPSTRRNPTLMTIAHLDQGQPDDQTGQVAGENAPVSSTVLPLLGLVGVGSLIAGFFMRR
jgi:hypothetical protein